MLSDVTISYAGGSLTLPGLYLLIGILIVLGLAGFVVALMSTRRIERKTTDATEILLVQLERIGDALDRIVNQSMVRPANEPVKRPERAAPERPIPERVTVERAMPGRTFTQRVVREGSALERAAQKSSQEQAAVPVAPDQPTAPAAEEQQPVQVAEGEKSNLSEPARTLLYNMLGRS